MRIFSQGKFAQHGWEIFHTPKQATITLKVAVTLPAV
jgi:hypothetical protein